MKATLSVRALVFLAVTNPLAWLLVVMALLLAVCGLAVLLYWALFQYARNELCSPRSSPSIPADDDWPLLAPTPELMPQLDEDGRVELVVTDPLAEGLDEQEGVTLESNAAVLPAPAAARTTKPKPAAAPKALTREQAEQLPHEQLVTLARRNGRVAANKRWGRDKLLAAVTAAQ